MTDIQHRQIETNGIRLHIAEAGKGPAVILCHGFPESWYSWRRQISTLAAAGYRVIAPDMRGYGQSSSPERVEDYTIFHLTGDILGLLDALKIDQAVIVGHDWGAPVAWHCALFRPDRFPAVAGLSVPYYPATARQPSLSWPQNQDEVFYQTYFQAPGIAEKELDRDPRETVVKMVTGWSANHDSAKLRASMMIPRRGGWLKTIRVKQQLPDWLSEADVDFYAAEFKKSGFRGGLNWYRNIDRNWQLLAPWAGAKIPVPALFMAGKHDMVLKFPGTDKLLANLEKFVPQLTDKIILDDCGHWIQRERPEEVNAALLAFFEHAVQK